VRARSQESGVRRKKKKEEGRRRNSLKSGEVIGLFQLGNSSYI